MQDLATKLMSPRKNSRTGQSSGGLSSLPPNRPGLRIGLWPIRSESDPSSSIGLVSLIGLLLDRWPSLQIYRLPAQVEGEVDAYNWTIEKSQFGVDDWQLDGLDENVAIWGSLELSESHYALTLEIENDLADDAADIHIETWKAANLTELVTFLPQIAESIAQYLGAGQANPMIPVYQIGQWDEHSLEQLLKAIFDWELKLYLKLWGKHWSDEQILDDYKRLLEPGVSLNDFGNWAVSNAAARAISLLCSSSDEGEFFLEYVEKISLNAATNSTFRHIVALALYRAGYPIRSYDLLEANVEYSPENVISWLTLIELYWQNGEFGTAVNTLQRAIQSGAASASIYVRYAEMLLLLDANNVIMSIGSRRTSSSGRAFIEGFILIDVENIKENRLIQEAVKAYQAALQLAPNNAEILSHLIVQLVELQEPSLWPQFEGLVELDSPGLYVRNVVETMYSLEDVSPAIKILASFANNNPDRVQIHIALASAYLLDEKSDAARVELEIAQDLSKDRETSAEIERLLLSADDPDFEMHLGEITDLLNAGNELNPDDIEFLELAVEKAPSFTTGYLHLANAYLNWDEPADALDTLLDGQRQLPEDPDIAALLARVLWQMNETQLAFDCLNKSLAKTPSHVPLLATLGRFLFEDKQVEEAKTFLAKAEALDPQNPFLNDTRIYIANIISDLGAD